MYRLMTHGYQLIVASLSLFLFCVASLCRGIDQKFVLLNDVTGCLSCTVTPLIPSTSLSGHTSVRFAESIQIDPTVFLSNGYFVSCNVGFVGVQDSESSVMEGVFAVPSTEPTAHVYHISHFLKSVTRVLSKDLDANQLLGALHSKDL